MKDVRTERLADSMLREVSMLLITEIKDPRLQGVTLTTARLTKDLRLLRLYFVPSRESEQTTREGLQRAVGFIRKEIARRMSLRHVPEIEFFYDESDNLKQKTEELLQELK